MIEFKLKEHNIKDKQQITMIIGLAPGKQRKNMQTRIVFEGNRTGDFITECIKGKRDVVLTNIVNFYKKEKLNKEEIFKEKQRLLDELNHYYPIKIICLGNFTKKRIQSFKLKNTAIFYFAHPSYILRFNKNKQEYKTELRELLSDE